MPARDVAVELGRTDALTDIAPYACAAVVSDARRLVLTAGACPLDAAGQVVAPGDVVRQAEQCTANLRTALAAAGAELSDVAKTTVRREHPTRGPGVGLGRRPAGARAPRTAQHAPRRHRPRLPGQLVEVEAVAALG